LRWLPEQLSSILGQHAVNVTVWVSDDASSDGTWDWLQQQSILEPRLKILPETGVFGSAAQNFYRLVRDAEWQGADYVAFADQDDIWQAEKLSRHSSLIEQRGLTAISSNVTAFWPDGGKVLIDKSHPQRDWDYFFGSAGPGCTYLMRPDLMAQLKTLLLDDRSVARQCALHDWLVYAICRATDGIWYIDPYPSVLYRQHDRNEFGANIGIRQMLRRIKGTHSGWHRQEAYKITGSISPLVNDRHKQDKLALLRSALMDEGFGARLRLLSFAVAGRRKFVERLALCILIASGVW
jgi:rhamnosyltransferase